MLNRVVLIGRLTRDPESKYTTNGIALANFGIAVDRPTRNQETGERETDFINVTAWRHTAEFVTQYLTKGRLVAVEGRLQVRSWVSQDGGRRTAYEVVADNVQGLDRPKDTDARRGPAPEGQTAQAAPAPGAPEVDDTDPFADE